MNPIPLMDLAALNQDVAPEILRSLAGLVERSEFIGGPALKEFEAEFARFTEAPHAIGIANGTHAISLALRAAGVGPGDEVITVAMSFIATVEAILDIGARPVLVDVDPASGLIDLGQVESVITPVTRAVVPVHLYGTPVDLTALSDLCRRKKLVLVQDAAQAHGARWLGKPLVEFGAAQTYSFYPGKNLGAWGDAGAVTTASADLAEQIRSTRDHGRRSGQKYLHHDVGNNYRMDPLQAVVLSAKLPRLAAGNQRRRELCAEYARRLSGVGDLRFFQIHPDATPVHHLCVIRTAQRDQLQKHLTATGVSTGIHYPVPLHQQPALEGRLSLPVSLAASERMAAEILSLPLYPELPDASLVQVTETVRGFFASSRTR